MQNTWNPFYTNLRIYEDSYSIGGVGMSLDRGDENLGIWEPSRNLGMGCPSENLGMG